MASTNEQSTFESLNSEMTLLELASSDPVQALRQIYEREIGREELNGYDVEQLCNGNAFDGVELKLVDEVGGYEGGGESVERVFQLTNACTGEALSFVRLTGSYYSHDGTYWDDTPRQVYPHQVTVTQYKEWQ